MKKLTFEYVKKFFEDNGCKLLAEKYINSKTPMPYICLCGNQSAIRFSEFKKGRRCKKCGYEKLSKLKTLDFNYVKKYFEDNGCKLLAEEYVNAHGIMPYICECGNQSNICFDNFKNGQRCSQCYGNKKHTLEYVKKFFEDKGCKLLAEKYINVDISMPYICECGNQSSICFYNFKNGRRCHKCGIEKRSVPRNSNKNQVELNTNISKKVRQSITEIVNMKSGKKQNRIHALLGYSNKELQERLESFSTWETLKNQDWHLDHIFPVTAFVQHGLAKISLINGLDNLQPLSKTENLKKHNKYNEDEFFIWLENKGFPINNEIIFPLLLCTENAAIEAFKLIGLDDKNAIDLVSSNAMRNYLNKINFSAEVVISEYEKDNAPGLHVGEIVGSNVNNSKPLYALAIDPVDGTTQVSKNGYESMSIMMLTTKGSLFSTRTFYMNKIAVGKKCKQIFDKLNIKSPIEDIIQEMKKVLGRSEISVCVLKRPRHEILIKKLINCRCKVFLIDDCDVSATICVGLSKFDLFLGIGGSTEGVISAAGLKCLGGHFEGYLVDDKTYEPIDNIIYKQDDLVKRNAIVVATGILNGNLLSGIEEENGQYTTHSLLLNSFDKKVSFITSKHLNYTIKD